MSKKLDEDVKFPVVISLNEARFISSNISNAINFESKNDVVWEVEAVVDDSTVTIVTAKATLTQVKCIKKIRTVPPCEVETASNIGLGNLGLRNEGNNNRGSFNKGHRNYGDCNEGDCNYGNRNLGSHNYGTHNMGSFNSGDNNIGDFNVGSGIRGIFNVLGDHDKSRCYAFGKPIQCNQLESWKTSECRKQLFQARTLGDITPQLWSEVARLPNFDFEMFKQIFNTCKHNS